MKINVKATQLYPLFILIFMLGCSTLVAENSTNSVLKTVTITSDNHCPYFCPDSLRSRGLVIEIVTASLAEVQYKTKYIDPKNRDSSIQNVATGVTDILLDAGDEHSELLDLSESFYVQDESVFVILKSRDITLNYLKDLWRYKLGIFEESIFDGEDGQWGKYITEHPNQLKISELQGEASLLELLTKKSIDIALVNWGIAQYKLEQSKLRKFRTIDKGLSSQLYLGFTPSERGKKIKAKFELGFNRLIDTEKLKSIYAKYHLKMPDFSIID